MALKERGFKVNKTFCTKSRLTFVVNIKKRLGSSNDLAIQAESSSEDQKFTSFKKVQFVLHTDLNLKKVTNKIFN